MRRDNPTARHADYVAENRENRHGYHAGNHSRDNEIIHRADRHNFERVNLLGDFHCAYLRRYRRTDTTRADYADQYRSQLSADCDCDYPADRRLRAETYELVRRLQRENHARKQQSQRNYCQRVNAQMCHLRDDVSNSRLVSELFHRVDIEQNYRAEFFEASYHERADCLKKFRQQRATPFINEELGMSNEE